MRRSGMTLVELLVVLSLLGLIFGIAGLATGNLRLTRTDLRAGEARRAREQAITWGRPVRATLDSASVLFLPDGRAIGSGVDPLTGAPRNEASR